MQVLSFFGSRKVSLACALALCAAPALAAPSLSFNAYAQGYGSFNTTYSSPLLGGDVSFSVNGPSDYRWYGSGSGGISTGVATASLQVAAGQGGLDPVYDVLTNRGQYSFSYRAEAEAAGTRLKTRVASSTMDHGALGTDPGTPTATADRTSMYAYSTAQWNQQFYIAPTASRAAGSYGAILVGITLDGSFPAPDPLLGINEASAWLSAGSSFTDTAGVNYNSNFNISTHGSDPSWSGSRTVYKKLLFQYGTVFNINLYQQSYTYLNGAAEFFQTGQITEIELPFGAVLDSGAEQAGLGDVGQLYGRVFQSSNPDAENTNWDFGNNGGGFTPSIPEPQTWAMALIGIGIALRTGARRKHAGA